MRYLYKYPQTAYPYEDLIRTNRAQGRTQPEYELIDTGIFDANRYFDVFVEFAKEGPEEILVRIVAWNRGPEPAELHVLPTLWFRNTWSWGDGGARPELRRTDGPHGTAAILARHAELGERWLYADGAPPLLFTENETNAERLSGRPNATPWVKDAFHRSLVHGETAAVNPAGAGTKAAAHYRLAVPSGGSVAVRLRLGTRGPAPEAESSGALFGEPFEAVLAERLREADAFYQSITPDRLDADAAGILRQALAGMLWTKQFYYYDLDRWLIERGADPLQPGGKPVPRNRNWYHMLNADVISMPDKWEYPWYAAWDLAFHAVALLMVDPDFAKDQLALMLSERYLHPNGQIPAYEWNFGDVNPPVHAWATLFGYFTEQAAAGSGDVDFLKRLFHKLAHNYTWWVNRKDRDGRNVFEGGFLGLDNIGVFDRSSPLPTGGCLEQADGTAWMALFAENMFEMALELALHDATYEDLAVKFLEHFLWIAAAMDRMGVHADEMWDEEDGFFYDLLRLPDGRAHRIRVRSMVGLLPLCASTVIPAGALAHLGRLRERLAWLLRERSELLKTIAPPQVPGCGGATCWPSSTSANSAACSPACSTKTSSWDPSASARSPAGTRSTPSRSTSAARSSASTTSPRSRTPGSSAATPTGGARSGCR